MSAVIAASLSARQLHPPVEGVVLMGPGVYIHNITPELARQWIGVLEPISKEGQGGSPKS